MSFYNSPVSHPGVAQLRNREQPILVTSTTPGVPVPLSTTRRFCRHADIRGKKSMTPNEDTDANASDVWIGKSSHPNEQPIAIGPNGAYILEDEDLSDWFLDVGTSGDGVVIQPQS